MSIDGNITKTYRYTSAAWRVAHHPEAITEAVRMGEQISDLLTQATRLLHSARREADHITQYTPLRYQAIQDRLTGEIDRLVPLLRRLRAAGAVTT
jgi:predicted HAD superfamily Cof-like phosphohydrolase